MDVRCSDCAEYLDEKYHQVFLIYTFDSQLQLAFVFPDEKFQLGAAEDDCVGAASPRRRQLARALDQEGAGLGAVDVEGELPLDDVFVYAGLGGRRGRHHDLIIDDKLSLII